MEQEIDYYRILEVKKDASQDGIKKAYRKLAIQWHPDKHQEDHKKTEAEKKFKSISEAYQVLSDPEKRASYDLHGKSGPNTHHRRRNGHHVFNDFSDPFFSFDMHFRDPFELFREVFGHTAGHPFFMDFTPVSARHHNRHSHHRHSPHHHPYQHQSVVSRAREYNQRDPLNNLVMMHSQMINPFGFSLGAPFFGSMGMGGMSSSFTSSSMGNGNVSFRSVSTSSRFVDGKVIKTTKVSENGKETVTEEVDGVVTQRYTIDKPQNSNTNEIIIIN